MKTRARRRAVLVLVGMLCAASASAAPAASPEEQARAILDATGVRGGLVVHLGCGDGRLTAALHASDAYLVQGLDADPARVAKARAHVRAGGLYGPVTVNPLAGGRLPYAPDLVTLVVADDLGRVPMDEVMRVLAPGGAAWVGGKTTVKPRPEAIDEWTHYLHGPDNNPTARDRRVAPPQRLRWKSDPMWCRSHDGVPSSILVVLSANGRLFKIVDEGLIGQPGLGQRWTLVARDAFSGVLLWKRPLEGRASQKSLVAVGDRLFATFRRNDPLTVLDAATGETLRTVDETRGSDELVCLDGTVVVHLRGPRKGGKNDTILAVDVGSGRIRWQTAVKPMVNHTLAAADGRVFLHNHEAIVCLDLATGKPLWQSDPVESGRRGGDLMVYGGSVLFNSGGMHAFDVETGKRLWKGPGKHGRLGFFGAQGLVWIPRILGHGRSFLWTPEPLEATGYNPRTGKPEKTVESSHLITPGHHVRCYPAKATERFLLLPKRGVEFVDLESTEHMRHNWLRAPCGHGVAAANGLLYVPPHQCFCYPGVKLAGFNAVAGGPEETPPKPSDEDRLVRGPAYGAAISDSKSQISNLKSEIPNDSSWPMYRHDPRRSGRAGGTLPADLATAWQRDLGGPCTQPVVAGGRLITAEMDAGIVHCLDAATGEPLWTHTAGGRIDSSPTLHAGRVLFGSADGRVTCLRASDGALVWRFLAAPAERLIVAFERVESAWPVHGSVLVQDGVAYCTAGRSSYLDDGLWVYALDPATGKVLHKRHLWSGRPDVTKRAGRPFDMDGTRTDLLVSDGTDLYMFFQRFGPDLAQKPSPRITKLGDRQVGLHLMSNAGFLDRTWFDRSYWTYSRRWPGYYFAYNASKTGRILVFDDERCYGLHVFATRGGHSPRFHPGRDGYELYADSVAAEPILRPTAVGREKGNGYERSRNPIWSVQVPVRAAGLVLAGDRLVLAGVPDVVPNDDRYAGIEGRLGARLWVVSAETGEKLAETDLDRPPVFDGLSAAAGRLYLAIDDGRVMCMGAK
jgi:outer membrane protein assembly factor BamB